MKKYLILAAALCMGFSLTVFAEDQKPADTNTPAATTEQPAADAVTTDKAADKQVDKKAEKKTKKAKKVKKAKHCKKAKKEAVAAAPATTDATPATDADAAK